MTDATQLSATELLPRYRDGALSPVEAVRAALERIDAAGEAVNAFVLVDGERALAEARASEQRWRRGAPLGALDGVPVTVKDLNHAQGWPTRAGSLTTDAVPLPADEPNVARLREAGAVLIGKTTTPEFGWKGVTDSPLTGITRNPWDTRLTPGGSSGGAAVAAALGMGALHLGGDGGGSIRIPAGFSGVFGIKPSFGRVPKFRQTSPVGLTQSGPLTRTVADAALMLNVLSRPDPRDWLALPYDGRDFTAALDEGVAGLKIAWSPDLGYVDVDPEVAALTERAARVFSTLGAALNTRDPGFASPRDDFEVHWLTAQICRQADTAEAQRARMDPGLIRFAERGEDRSLLDFARAATARVRLGETLMEFFIDYDLLLTPTLPIPAFAAGAEVPPDDDRYRSWIDWTPFTYPFNLTGHPAAACPCGFTRAGLPVSLQIVGPLRDEATVLRAARAFERVKPFRMPDISPAA